MPILGVVENMSGLDVAIDKIKFFETSNNQRVDVTSKVLESIQHVLPNMNAVVAQTEVYHGSKGGAATMAEDLGVPLLGKIPLDPLLSKASDAGQSVLDISDQACSYVALKDVIQKLLKTVGCNDNGY